MSEDICRIFKLFDEMKRRKWKRRRRWNLTRYSVGVPAHFITAVVLAGVPWYLTLAAPENAPPTSGAGWAVIIFITVVAADVFYAGIVCFRKAVCEQERLEKLKKR